ncbi:MAG: DUF6069 family protein [Halobacteriales archaeon]|nr:DUF6069 family protein [Halobacteriales archaeon]
MATTDSRSSDLLRRGAAAAVLAVAVNAVLVFAATASGAVEPFTHLEYPRVALFTIGGVGGASLVYGLIRRRRERPDRDFAIVAAVVLVLSWIPDVTVIPTVLGATTGGVAVLMALHATTAAISYAVLTR